MQKSKLIRKGRKGFTLVEVALAVAVGLIIIGGAVLGYNAVKDNASNSNARNRVLSAVTMVEEYSAANGGRYPVSVAAGGAFTNMWVSKRSDDYALSPWGGAAGGTASAAAIGTVPAGTITGALELAPFNAGYASSTAAAAGAESAHLATAQAANNAAMLYATITPNAGNQFAAIMAQSTSSMQGVKAYAVGIHDKTGTPWWDVKGGK